jgi:PTS system nitrogen regulatory IIA component
VSLPFGSPHGGCADAGQISGVKMKIEDILTPSDTLVDLRASDRARLIQDMAGRAASALGLDASDIAQELIKRESLGSTGVGNGIAMPHARIQALQKPFGLLVRLKKPIDFDAIDGRPIDLVFLLLLPAVAGEHINALATVARKMREPGRLDRMRRAPDAAALFHELVQ